MLIEHPRRADRELVTPEEYAERTADLYRFRVSVQADDAREFIVRERQPISERITLLDRPADAFAEYIATGAIRDEVREALRQAAELRAAYTTAQREHDELERELREIRNGQERLRRNLEAVGQDTSLGQRYLARLAEDEDRIEEIESQLEEARAKVEETRRAFEEYVSDLDV